MPTQPVSTFLPSHKNPEPIAYSRPGNTTQCLNHSLLFQADPPLPGGPSFSTRKPLPTQATPSPGTLAYITSTLHLVGSSPCVVTGLSELVSLPKQCLSSLQRAVSLSPAYPDCPLQVWAEQSLHRDHRDVYSEVWFQLFSASSQYTFGGPAASCPPSPKARPSPSALAIYRLLHPAFTRVTLSSRLLPPSQIITGNLDGFLFSRMQNSSGLEDI